MRWMMTAQEHLKAELSGLSAEDIDRVARFVSLLKHYSRTPGGVSEEVLRVTYAEASEEDRVMAREGMSDYSAGLKKEDHQ